MVGDSIGRTVERIHARFMEHPRKERMSYCEHAMKTLMMSFWMAKGSVALAIHSVFPFWFEKTGENAAKQIDDEVIRQLLRLESMKSN